MGNSPLTPTSLRCSNTDHPYQIQLGRSAFLQFKAKEVEQQPAADNNGRLFSEKWRVLYQVDKLACDVTLVKFKGKIVDSIDGDEGLIISIEDALNGGSSADDFYFTLVFLKLEARLFRPKPDGAPLSSRLRGSPYSKHFTATTKAAAGDTERYIYTYGLAARRRGLVVWDLMKKKNDDKRAYMATVTHYYASAVENGNHVGISVTVKGIGVSDRGDLDYVVDGPEKHPATALLHMFDQVATTRTWEPTYCVHCADRYITQGQAGQSQVSAPKAISRGLKQNIARSLVANAGSSYGDQSGNVIVQNAYFIRSHRRVFGQYDSEDSDMDYAPPAAPPRGGRRYLP